MDGSISLEPREDGPGTRARIRLPLPDPERDAAGEA